MNIKFEISKPELPQLEKLNKLLEEIWDNQYVTNNGPFLQEFEKQLANLHGVDSCVVFNNATIALIASLKVLGISGEVLTSPFSFIATASSIVISGNKPVFLDIEENSPNLDPKLIQKSLTHSTRAIMPVHAFGVPCKVLEIDAIAKKHNLKVIYDAAHAFNSNCHCGSIMSHGDISVLSMHATKLLSSIEGGACFTNNSKIAQKLRQFRNFGIEADNSITEVGLNGKMDEINAAVGILNLESRHEVLEKRKIIYKKYKEIIGKFNFIDLYLENKDFNNYSYMPIIIDGGIKKRDLLYEFLLSHSIQSKKYFYPILSNISVISKYSSIPFPLANATELSNSILCLPLHSKIEMYHLDYFEQILRAFVSKAL